MAVYLSREHAVFIPYERFRLTRRIQPELMVRFGLKVHHCHRILLTQRPRSCLRPRLILEVGIYWTVVTKSAIDTYDNLDTVISQKYIFERIKSL